MSGNPEQFEDDSKWAVITSYNHPNPFAALPADCQETLRELLTATHTRWLMADARADSRSAPGIDSINPAKGEQPCH